MRLPDIQIRGGTLIDGTGAAPFSGCVDITDGKISAVGGPELPAREIIDASGLTDADILLLQALANRLRDTPRDL